MQPTRYPRILPATPVKQPGDSTPSSASERPDGEKKRRASQHARPGACVECRNRKTRCDGIRPACTNCTRRGLPLCNYPERLVNGHKSMEMLELFKSLREDRAIALLKLLRERGDATTVLTEFKSGQDEAGSLRPSDAHGSVRHHNSLERELMAHNPQAYPVLLPIDPGALASSNLLRPKASLPVTSQSNTTGSQYDYHPIMENEKDGHSEQEPHYCDDRLHNLRREFWTDIDISSDRVARAISLYIRTDHPLLGLFNPSLFIADLVNQETHYCSRFLFHSLMYLACQMYSAFDRDMADYADQFRRAAEKFWEAEEDSYSAMAGAVLMSIALMGHGVDHAVLRFSMKALDMGQRLELLKPADQLTGHEPSKVAANEDALSAKCYAAWGTFNWNVLVSMFYRQPGSETPKVLPTVPIPGGARAVQGHNRESDSDEEMEQWSQHAEFPHDEQLLGSIFPALCNLWRIVHRARWIYYNVEKSPPAFLRNSQVEFAFRELIAWAEALPPDLIRKDRGPHYVTVFHIWLHTAILDIWQPFVYKEVNEVPILRTFTASVRTPDAAYTASVNQLKHLVVEYRSRYAASTYSILWHNGLIYLANAMLRCKDPEWRLYLLLCIYGYERLHRAYRFSELVIQGLLTMSMRDTDMSGSEAYKILESLRSRGLLRVDADVQEKLRATFMIDLNLALTDPEAATAETMADGFHETALFQDLIDLDAMQT
ncbi:hypothetical protein F5Y17DRAFT_468381 [Xylariaceae sp. FL0594]|nr:hypothetical protein F5Y17DRAFT_468381 [Xylariaceae sp. FL0594]